MTLFGRTLGAEEIAGLVFMLAMLVLWLNALRGERAYGQWFKQWEADRKARREAEQASEARAAPSAEQRGPWG